MRATLLGVEAPVWNSVLRSGRHDFYHLPTYLALSASQAGGRPHALHVTDAEQSMLLPLIIRDVDGGGVDATSPYGYPGPVGSGVGEAAFLADALAAGLELLRETGVVSAFVRLHPLLNPSPPVGIGTLVHHGLTVSVDLTLPVEQLWSGMRANHRRDVTRTRRLGWVTRIDEDWAHFDAFKQRYRTTMERRGATPFYHFDDRYFEDLRTALGDRLHLCVVERAGLVSAAGLFVETDSLVEYHLSGTDAESVHLHPLKSMIHDVSVWAKRRGNERLHLGGGVGGAADSLFQFKSGFSPLRHPFSTLRIVLDEPRYRALVAARDPNLDPENRLGFFPAYRQAGAVPPGRPEAG